MIAGRYELEREIGRGGAGIVWLGRDRVLGRHVALKQIGRLPGGTDVDVERADREARLSASIRHPNIVAAFDLAIDDSTGDRWLVMEYVDGASLGQLVRDRGPIAPEPAARIMAQVADALAAAHAAGITHRDVKPSNILLERDGTPKLTDFGIARTISDPQLTQTGLLSGSPAYLAPEVASGQRGDMTADVWSWGATLFHLLAGRPPYDVGDNVLGAMYRLVNDEPPRLPDAGPLAPVLEHTMVKDPAQRWPMSRVRDELAAIARGEVPADHETQVLPVVPAGPAVPLVDPAQVTSAAPVPQRWRRPLLAVLAVLAVVVVVAVLASLLNGGGGDGGTPAAHDSTTGTSSTATGPTAAGMQDFIRTYVTTVADDPAAAWQMLTPRFQRESGGFATYQRFWEPAENGTVTDIQADPTTLQVSYRPHFDHWHNNPNPTRLVLVYTDGHYLIDAEHTVGFTPAATTSKPIAPPPAPKPHDHHKGKGHKKK
ncbi:serine/threonine-protein kinase [Nocardioides ultimimeridianus]